MTRPSHGWNKDRLDSRDHVFSATRHSDDLPPTVDLRPQMPPAYDQGSLGSCTANAIGAALEYLHNREGLGALRPSRLFIYYNERALEDCIREDSGARIRDGIKTVNKLGACDESTWAYDITKFKKKPPVKAFKEAKQHMTVSYRKVTSVDDILHCLADGCPVVFGFEVYDTLYSAATGSGTPLEMPKEGEECQGGHAVLAVGYDRAKQLVLVRNSWGPEWGMDGYFWMPFSYFTQELASDLWTIQTMI